MSFELLGDCASDPPLGATARVLGEARAADVVYGLGALAVETKAKKLAIAFANEVVRSALQEVIEKVGAKISLIEVGAGWPARLPPAKRIASAAELVRAAERARGKISRRYVTVAGAVAAPSVLVVEEGAAVEELVARAGGATCDDWVAVAGGAPNGRLVERGATVEDETILIVPAGHEVARRLRTPVADWLVRAASACEGCRACTDACPPSLAGAPLRPHELVWTLATLRDDGTAPAAALACDGCGACDVVCPSRLSPRALVTGVRDRLREAGAAAMEIVAQRARPEAGDGMNGDMNAHMNGLDRELVTLRLGLGPFVQPVAVRV